MQQYPRVRNALAVLGEASQRPAPDSRWIARKRVKWMLPMTAKAGDSGAGSNAGPILFLGKQFLPELGREGIAYFFSISWPRIAPPGNSALWTLT